MIPFGILVDAAAVLLTGGIFLLLFNAMDTALELFLRLWQRIFRSRVNRRLHEMGILEEQPDHHIRLDWQRLCLWLAVPLLALLVRDVMLSPLVAATGVVVVIRAEAVRRQQEEERIGEDAEMAALQIRALMATDHSILNALSRVELPEGALKQAVARAASRLRMHQPPEQAVQAFRGLPGPLTARLSALIAHSARLTDALQNDLFLSLEQEVQRQKVMRSKTRQTLTLVRGTIRLLQGAAGAALFFVMLMPVWRQFFLQDLPHRLLLMTLICASILASLYFEFEVHQIHAGEAA